MKLQLEIMQENFNPERGTGVKSRLRQYLELLLFKATRMYSPNEYYLYHFNHKNQNFKLMLDYLSARDLDRFCRPALNNPAWAPLLENKWLSYLHFSRLGLPTTEVLGIYKIPNGTTIQGEPLSTPEEVMEMLRKKKPSSLVMKPLAGKGGKGISIFQSLLYNSDDIIGQSPCGAEISLKNLLSDREILSMAFPAQGTKSVYHGWLLESMIPSHPFFQRICPYSLPSIRIVTFINSANKPEVHFCSVRLGRKGLAVSNASSAAIIAKIDIKTGRMSHGTIMPRFGFAVYDSHPDCGEKIAGEIIPLWDQVLELCLKAARLTPGHRSVGWDIALTPQGPIIMEANQKWSLPLSQALMERGYLTPERRRQLAEMGLEFPSGGVGDLLKKRLLKRKFKMPL